MKTLLALLFLFLGLINTTSTANSQIMQVKENLYCAYCYLSGADLSGENLRGVHLYGSNLSGADLSRADLSRANLTEVDLSGANLTGANLTGANLTGANLTGANDVTVNLTGANLTGVKLSGARLVEQEKKSIENYLKKLKEHSRKLQDPELDSLKVEADELISEVEANTSSDLNELRGLTKTLRDMNLKIKTEESKQRILSLKDYPGFKDLKPGLHYEDVLEICPLEKADFWGLNDEESERSDWVRCYGINNIRFQAYYSDDDLLEWLSLDMGPIVETGGYLSIFGENDSNIFIKMKNIFDKKYSLDYGYSERDRQLFNESEKLRLNTVYANGKVDLRIIRKETDYSYELWLYINYLDPYQAEIFLNKNRPVRASEDDF